MLRLETSRSRTFDKWQELMERCSRLKLKGLGVARRGHRRAQRPQVGGRLDQDLLDGPQQPHAAHGGLHRQHRRRHHEPHRRRLPGQCLVLHHRRERALRLQTVVVGAGLYGVLLALAAFIPSLPVFGALMAVSGFCGESSVSTGKASRP